MSEPSRCYAVSSGTYSEYEVIAIYRRREDALTRVKTNNEAPVWLLDGEPYLGRPKDAKSGSLVRNPARRKFVELYVEEFDYYEGEPLPAPLEDAE